MNGNVEHELPSMLNYSILVVNVIWKILTALFSVKILITVCARIIV